MTREKAATSTPAPKPRASGTKSPTRKKASAPSSARAGAPDPLREAVGRLEASLAAMRDELAALRRDQAALASGGSDAALAAASSALRATTERLATMIGEVPKAEEFQPLADHLYEVARNAPKLIEGLDALQATYETWSESLLRLPRAEDYEPLAAPLREFARVSPALAESLAGAMKGLAPLQEVGAELREAIDALRSAQASLAGSPRPSARHAPPPAAGVRDAAGGAAAAMAEAGRAIRGALDTLPRDPEYGRVAAQLREIASVSPSLTEWLNEVPKLTAPLSDSVSALRTAADRLQEAEGALREALGRRS